MASLKSQFLQYKEILLTIISSSSILHFCNGITLDNPSLSSLNSPDNNDCIPPHCPPPPPSPSSAHNNQKPFMSPWGQLHHHQQTQQHNNNNENNNNISSVPRGGAAARRTSTIRASTATPPSITKRQQTNIRRRPIINPATISLALRLTCEMNRQITNDSSSLNQDGSSSLFHSSYNNNNNNNKNKNKKGIERYGPNLTSYISTLLSSLQPKVTNPSLVLLLSIIYLDRACSIETPRTYSSYQHQQYQHGEEEGRGLEHVVNGYCPPLPYITPRTVHRLITTAIILAHKAVNPSSSSSSSTNSNNEAITNLLLQKANMDKKSMETMMDWMLHSMGDLGLYVSVDVLEYWMDSWGGIFGVVSTDDDENENEEDYEYEERYEMDGSLEENDGGIEGGYNHDSYHGYQQHHQQQQLYGSSSSSSSPYGYGYSYNEDSNTSNRSYEDDEDDNNNDSGSYWGSTHDAAMSCWS